MDKPLLAYTLWLSYTDDQRKKLVKLFGIPRTGEVVVHVGEMMNGNIGGSAKQDGHKPEDLYAITTERMQQIIGTQDTDFYNMFQHVIDNLDVLYLEQFPEAAPAPVPEAPAPVPQPPQPEPEAEFVPRDPEELLSKPVAEPAIDEPKPEPDAKATKAKAAKPK